MTVPDDASASAQLKREAYMSLPPLFSTPPNVTPDRRAPSNKVPSSRKSVHFDDPIATESAGLLSRAVKEKEGATAKRGRPKGKLVRPSSFSVPISPKRQLRQKLAMPQRDQSYAAETLQDLGLPEVSGEVDIGERRSGRSRENVTTYNEVDTTRTLWGQTSKSQAVTSPSTHVEDRVARSSGSTWTKDEFDNLKQAREAGLSWEEIQKVCRSEGYDWG